SADQSQVFEALKKKRREEAEALLRKKEEEDMEAFLASFKKDRQGAITSTGEIKLSPLLSKSTEPSVSTSQFSDDQMFEVDCRISDSSQLNWNAMLEYIKASKNTPCASAGNVGANSDNPKPTLPISSVPSNDTLVSS